MTLKKSKSIKNKKPLSKKVNKKTYKKRGYKKMKGGAGANTTGANNNTNTTSNFNITISTDVTNTGPYVISVNPDTTLGQLKGRFMGLFNEQMRSNQNPNDGPPFQLASINDIILMHDTRHLPPADRTLTPERAMLLVLRNNQNLSDAGITSHTNLFCPPHYYDRT